MMKTTTPFLFDKGDIDRHVQYELRTLDKIGTSFNYVFSKLKALGQYKKVGSRKVDLSKAKWNEGKNYDWLAIENGNDVRLLLRRYHEHFTIFTSFKKQRKDGRIQWDEKEFGCFTFHTNRDLIPKELVEERGEDFYYENEAFDLNGCLHQIFDLVRKRHVHCVWNSLSLVRPKYVEVKLAYIRESIHSYDLLIFACEELSNIHLGLFAQIDMFARIQSVNAGDTVGRYKVEKVYKELKNEYYHGVGIKFVKSNGGDHMQDVYSLSHWYLEDLFPSEVKPS
jgi:hypothetical protein